MTGRYILEYGYFNTAEDLKAWVNGHLEREDLVTIYRPRTTNHFVVWYWRFKPDD